MKVLKEFAVSSPEPEVYAHSVIEENGKPIIRVRGKSALMINSSMAKSAANAAKNTISGFSNYGLEQWGGAYIVDKETGDFMANPPHVKEGQDASVLPIRYEVKFKINATI